MDVVDVACGVAVACRVYSLGLGTNFAFLSTSSHRWLSGCLRLL